ncbi:hypothetical protein CFK41_17395 [Brachybacterium ginsengisoli]|uniref:Regulator of SigK n=1 Tax=Brachybacterium ginsengisoli TaxID=1331682 RepID=A0A291H1K3_9MICO|nr:anti-sigma factor [Brachybacterium ginsengisoli]ATG56358.1 hypothetical protein CFK41_17395 [Brachybacterium ginsengisoli]
MSENEHGMTGAWALNALDAEEREQVRRYLAKDPEAAAEARAFEETAGELATSVTPLAPPPALKAAVMGRIATTRQLSPLPEEEDPVVEDAPPSTSTPPSISTPPSAPSTAPPSTAPSAQVVPLDRYRASVRRSRWTAAAAAVLLVTTIVGAGLWNAERTAQQEARASLEAMASEQAVSDQERAMVSAIMSADDAAHLAVPAENGGSLEVMYSRGEQAMIVQPVGLPELPQDETYQLWMIDASGAASAGVLEDPAAPMMRPGGIPAGSSLGLSIEPAGGSAQPSPTVVAVGEL